MFLQPINDAITEAVGKMIAGLVVMWMKDRTPTLNDGDWSNTPKKGGALDFLLGNLGNVSGSGLSPHTIIIAVMTISLVIGGFSIVITQRYESVDNLLKMVVTLAVVDGGAVMIVSQLNKASDKLAENAICWGLKSGPGQTLNQATCDGYDTTALGNNMKKMLDPAQLSPALALLIGLVILVSVLVQIIMMIVRNGMIIILLGTLTVSAAVSNTESGRAWLRRSVGWLISFLMFKPAAALVYALAFHMANGDPDQANNSQLGVLTGLVLLILAGVCLPALMKLVAPMVGGITSGAALQTALLSAGAVGVGAAAKGAMNVAGNLGKGGKGGRGADFNPNGPQGSLPNTNGPTGAAIPFSPHGNDRFFNGGGGGDGVSGDRVGVGAGMGGPGSGFNTDPRLGGLLQSVVGTEGGTELIGKFSRGEIDEAGLRDHLSHGGSGGTGGDNSKGDGSNSSVNNPCYQHSDQEAVTNCGECGQPICQGCITATVGSADDGSAGGMVCSQCAAKNAGGPEGSGAYTADPGAVTAAAVGAGAMMDSDGPDGADHLPAGGSDSGTGPGDPGTSGPTPPSESDGGSGSGDSGPGGRMPPSEPGGPSDPRGPRNPAERESEMERRRRDHERRRRDELERRLKREREKAKRANPGAGISDAARRAAKEAKDKLERELREEAAEQLRIEQMMEQGRKGNRRR